MNTTRAKHLGYLDGLRGIAALWVLVAHCMIWGAWYWRRIPDPKIAVDLFMVLSGYLMVYQWYLKREDQGRVTPLIASRFYLRRFFRIAPLYYLVLTFTFLIAPRFLHGYAVLRAFNPTQFGDSATYDPSQFYFGPRNFLMHITFLFGLSPRYAFSTFLPDWSISLEMQFYAMFPLLLLCFRKIGPILTTLGVLLAVKLYYHTGVQFPEPSFLPIKVSVFLMGMLLAEGVRRFADNPISASILGLIAVLISPQDSQIIAGVAVLLFFLGITANETAINLPTRRVRAIIDRLLGNRLTDLMADASYAVYLTHGFFVSLAGGWLFSQERFIHLRPQVRVAILMAITLCGCYGVSWVLHLTIEKPGIALGRRIVAKIPTKPVVSEAGVQVLGGV